MLQSSETQATCLLLAIGSDETYGGEMPPRMECELPDRARGYLVHGRTGQTLRATDLFLEVCLRLVGASGLAM